MGCDNTHHECVNTCPAVLHMLINLRRDKASALKVVEAAKNLHDEECSCRDFKPPYCDFLIALAKLDGVKDA
jgi:hypothetical protein